MQHGPVVSSRLVSKKPQHRTLREFVAAQPRSVTQRAIASNLGLSEPALSAYLAGHRIPSRAVGLHISKLTGIPLEGLLDPEIAFSEKDAS